MAQTTPGANISIGSGLGTCGTIGGGGSAGTTIYVSPNQSYGGSSYLQMIGSHKKRGPYKKDKFNVSMQAPLGMNVTDVVGKVKTLAQIGEMLDNLKPSEQITLIITKKP